MKIDNVYQQSFAREKLLQIESVKLLKEYYSDFEIINMLKKYNVGADKNGREVYWFLNEMGNPYSLLTKKEYYFDKPGIMNLHLLENEKPERVGIVENIADMLFANLYMRRWAWFTYVGPGADFKPLKSLHTFAVVNDEKSMYTLNLKQNLKGIKCIQYDDFTKELRITGKPKPFYFPPKSKNKPKTILQFKQEALKNPNFVKLMDNLQLEFC